MSTNPIREKLAVALRVAQPWIGIVICVALLGWLWWSRLQ